MSEHFSEKPEGGSFICMDKANGIMALLSLVRVVNKETPIALTEKGMYIRVNDPQRLRMIEMDIPHTFFETFELNRPEEEEGMLMFVDLESVLGWIGRAEEDYIWKVQGNTHEISLPSKSGSSGRTFTTTFPGHIDTLQKVELKDAPVELTVNMAAFGQYLEDCYFVSDKIEIEVNETGLLLKAGADSALNKVRDQIFWDDPVIIKNKFEEDQKMIYKLSLILPILRTMGSLYEEVDIKCGDYYPMVVGCKLPKVDVEEIGEVTYWISPAKKE